MRLNEGTLPKDLQSYMQDCLDEFVSSFEDEMENGVLYDTDVEAMIERFKQDYAHAPQHHLFYDFYDTLKTIKAFSFDQIYNLYSPSQDEFDEKALFSALDKLVLNSFVDKNRSVFEELADSMNDLYGMSRDVKKGLDAEKGKEKKESRSMKVRSTSGRRMTEDYDDEFEGGINGYAVQIHDYTKGYINLLCYSDIEDAEYAEERLDALWQESEDGNISDEEYFYELSDILTFADSYIEEIDFRRNIDSDNCYSDRRYGRWQIINEVPCPVYL